MNVSDSLSEDREAVLEQVAITLAKAIDDCESARDLPPLVKQLREVMDELEQIRPSSSEQEETMFERLKRERAERPA